MHKLWSAFTKLLRKSLSAEKALIRVDNLGSFFKQEDKIKFLPASSLSYKLTVPYNAQTSGDIIGGHEQMLNYRKIGSIVGCTDAKEKLDQIFRKAVEQANLGNSVLLSLKVGNLQVARGRCNFNYISQTGRGSPLSSEGSHSWSRSNLDNRSNSCAVNALPVNIDKIHPSNSPRDNKSNQNASISSVENIRSRNLGATEQKFCTLSVPRFSQGSAVLNQTYQKSLDPNTKFDQLMAQIVPTAKR